MRNRKKWIKFILHICKLSLQSNNQTAELVNKSYDKISSGYDESWTNHMRDKTLEILDLINIPQNSTALDLTCGTGYATSIIASRTQNKVTGVDRSSGMLEVAKTNCPENTEFIQADILNYLKSQPNNSFDIITCCWGLGYSKPYRVLKEAKRILKKGGKIGIIDNSLFSLKEVIKSSTLAFAEEPKSLKNLMKFNFLASKGHLKLLMRLAGLKVEKSYSGSKSYQVDSGKEAIERLKRTGAAAGFEFAAQDDANDRIFDRFADIMEQKYQKNGKITLTHRYIAGIGTKR